MITRHVFHILYVGNLTVNIEHPDKLRVPFLLIDKVLSDYPPVGVKALSLEEVKKIVAPFGSVPRSIHYIEIVRRIDGCKNPSSIPCVQSFVPILPSNFNRHWSEVLWTIEVWDHQLWDVGNGVISEIRWRIEVRECLGFEIESDVFQLVCRQV